MRQHPQELSRAAHSAAVACPEGAPHSPFLLAWTGLTGLCGWALLANWLNVTTAVGRFSYAGLALLLLVGFVSGYLFLWRPKRGTSASRKPVSRRLFITTVASLQLLAAAESLARVFPVYDSMALNPASHFMWPEYYLSTNSLGYKDREPGPKVAPRILVLGDSYAEGAGVRRTQRFSAVLEQLYRSSTDPDLEVFNAGRCGMDTADAFRMLLATGDMIAPDAVVLVYVPNDADGHGTRPIGARPSLIKRAAFALAGYSYAFYRLRCESSQFCGFPPPIDQDPLLSQHRPESAGWRLVLESLKGIGVWCEQRDIPAYLVALPLFTEYGERYRAVLDQVVSAARQRGFQARSGIDDYGPSLAKLGVSAHDGHPGSEAHRLTAEAIQRFLGRPWAEREPLAGEGMNGVAAARNSTSRRSRGSSAGRAP